MKVMDAQIRITQKDLNDFGYTENCPKCQDIIARRSWKRSHSDECRLRLYMEYQRSEHPKWKAIRHLFDSEEKPQFAQGQVDVEGAARTPTAFDGSNVLDQQEPEHVPKDHEPNRNPQD